MVLTLGAWFTSTRMVYWIEVTGRWWIFGVLLLDLQPKILQPPLSFCRNNICMQLPRSTQINSISAVQSNPFNFLGNFLG
jgi:hypothetical protein